MKKLTGLCLAFMLVLSACTPSSQEAPAKFKAGSYSGSAKGMNGDVVLEVTLSEEKIESITVTEQQETAGLGDAAIDRMIENIINSQSIQVETVSGATVSSNAVLTAVTNALSEAGVDASTLEPKTEDKQTSVEDATADIVVIGGGGAGLSAAIEAADAGTEKIIVLEKMLNTGGTTATAQGMIAGYETKVQKASKDEPITYDAMVANLMNNALWKLDPALTKITVESSGQTIDWLIDRAEVEFQPDALVGYGPLKMMLRAKSG